jgi:hypothetical protein
MRYILAEERCPFHSAGWTKNEYRFLRLFRRRLFAPLPQRSSSAPEAGTPCCRIPGRCDGRSLADPFRAPPCVGSVDALAIVPGFSLHRLPLRETITGTPGRRGNAMHRRATDSRIGRRPVRSLASIRAWGDAHHQRMGTWPTRSSGWIAEAPGETWAAVESSLRLGNQGLPGGSSLARLLQEHRWAGEQSPARPANSGR